MAFNYKTTADNKILYIPKCYGQRGAYQRGDDPNPVTIHIRLITMSESEEWGKRVMAIKQPAGVDEEGSPVVDTNAVEIGKLQFFSAVNKIENLSFNDQPIMTGKELWGSPYKDLVTEVGLAIRDFNVLMAGDIQNLKLQPNGFSEQTIGTAKPA